MTVRRRKDERGPDDAVRSGRRRGRDRIDDAVTSGVPHVPQNLAAAASQRTSQVRHQGMRLRDRRPTVPRMIDVARVRVAVVHRRPTSVSVTASHRRRFVAGLTLAVMTSRFPVSDADSDTSSETAPGTDGIPRPVAVELPRPTLDAVRGWVEGMLGWQAVDPTTARLVPPTVRLVGPDAPPPDDPIPRVLLLPVGVGAAAAAAAAIRCRAAAVLVWPDDRDRLAQVVAGVVDHRAPGPDGPRVLHVGGVSGGVGTTTVVLALAGLAGWTGIPSLAALRGDAPVAGLPIVEASAIADPDLWSRLPQPPGTQGLRAVRIADPATIATPTDPAIDLAVLDHGVDVDVDVVICRPDAAALEGLASTTAAVVVLVGSGPVAPRELAQVTGGRRCIHLPRSARVARAGRFRRVPAGLPGAWLRRLQPLVSPASPHHPVG